MTGIVQAVRANGVPWREASIIGMMMNTRADGLIVINIGYDLGVIPKSAFFMLLFIAVVNTCRTSPILRRLVPGSEIEK